MNRTYHSIALMCRLYEVTRDGYNAWRRRGESVRRQEDNELYVLIKQVFDRHDGCYGSPKITRELRKQGIPIGQKRVARIMREHGLKAVKARLYRTKAYSHAFLKASPNRILDIEPTRPNQLWVGDVTYIRMPDSSWQYLSVIMDRFSRRIIAWSLSNKRDAALTTSTIERAVRNRGCHQDLIFHSDKGVEYIAKSFRKRLSNYRIVQSMNRVKEMNDNAFIESFFQDFKTERIKRRIFKTVDQLRAIISEYMRYYNYERSHSSIGYISPVEYECRISS
jgi:transposase InsO family protein